MKLLMFEKDGRPCLGLWKDEGIVDLSLIPGAPQTMEEAMGLDALGVIEKLAEGQSALAPQSVRFLTPVARPEKILCIGLNYKPHIEEFEKSAGFPPTLSSSASLITPLRPITALSGCAELRPCTTTRPR